MSSKYFFFGQEMVPQFKGIENWDHEISFPRPWIWFSISYAKPSTVINGTIEVLTFPLCSWSLFLFIEIIDSGAKPEWERQTIHLFLHLQCHVLDRENFCSTSNRSNSTAKSRPTPNFLSGKNNDFQDVLPPPAICVLVEADPGVQASRL